MVSPCFSFPKMFHCHIKLREGTPLRRLDKADGSKMAKLMVQSHRWVLVEYPEYPWRTKGWPLVQRTVPWWVRLKIEYPLVHHVPHYFMALAGMYTPCSDRPTTHITIIYIYLYYTDTFLRQWCLVTSYNISDIYIYIIICKYFHIYNSYIYMYVYIYIFTIYVYTPLKPAVFLVFFQVDDPNMTDAGYGSRWVMGPSRDGAAKSLGIWDTLW